MLCQMICCGVDEAEEIRCNTPEQNLEYMFLGMADSEWRRAFIIFTDHKQQTYGKALAKYIKKHKLGKIHVTRSKRNPNTDNMIRVWVWDFNKKNWFKWAKKQNWWNELEYEHLPF